eukprot:377578_1
MGCCQTATLTPIHNISSKVEDVIVAKATYATDPIPNNYDIIYIVFSSGQHRKRSIQSTFSHTFKDIKSIHTGDGFTIIVDSQNMYWRWDYRQDNQVHSNCRQVSFFNVGKRYNTIKKICTSSNAQHMFWITKDNKVYGNGPNHRGQLGKEDVYRKFYRKHIDNFIPTLIPTLHNAIDIQGGRDFSIALCAKYDPYLIIIYWFRIFKSNIIHSIIHLMNLFCANTETEVYSTGYSYYVTQWRAIGWTKIEELENKFIIKIAVGGSHSLFLTENGNVWSCGDHRIVGRKSKGTCNRPALITFFENNNIKIRDIKCGENHCLAIDVNNNVYIWGLIHINNNCLFTPKNIIPNNNKFFDTPRLIKSNIMDIDCGGLHSYCRTEDNKYLLFGGNYSAQCLVFEEETVVDVNYNKPNCINKFIEKEFMDRYIKQVGFGTFSTQIVLSSVEKYKHK